MPKKSSTQLDREIKDALAKRDAVARSRRLGSRAAHSEIATTNFAFDRINDESAKRWLRDDKRKMGEAIDDTAWLAGWRVAIAEERREYDLNRAGEPYIPLDLGFLVGK